MANVLFINGIRDDGYVGVKNIINNNTLQYINEGSCNVYSFLRENIANTSILTLDSNQSQDININNIKVIFNQISDPDNHKISLAKSLSICEQLEKTTYCINHPKNIISSSREKLQALLKDIPGIVMPKTLRFSPNSSQQIIDEVNKPEWNYPVLIRHCGDHNAKSLTLLKHENDIFELEPTYYDRECYLTEFVDFSDENGVFAKYRFVCVDGNVFIRHIMYGDQWEVHSHVRKQFMKQNSRYFDLEHKTVTGFNDDLKHRVIHPVQAIHKALGLDYFGIDCSINKQGKLIIFEANANMNMLYNPYPKPNTWQAQVDQLRTALLTMISKRAKT